MENPGVSMEVRPKGSSDDHDVERSILPPLKYEAIAVIG